MLRSLFAVAAAATFTVVSAQVGNGVDGDICGDTGLGLKKALLDAVKGSGYFNTMPMTVSGNQIIINLPEADGHVPLKAVECVYNVAVNYSSSSVNIMTGPPGVMGMRDAQRCWNLHVTDSGDQKSIAVSRTDYGMACSTATPAGAISNFSDTVNPGYGAACAIPELTSSGLTGKNLTAIAGPLPNNTFAWLTPTMTAISTTSVAIPNLGYVAMVTCFESVSAVTHTVSETTGQPSDIFVATDNKPFVHTGAASECYAFNLNTRMGLMQYYKADGDATACNPASVTWTATDGSVTTLPAGFPMVPLPAAAAAAAAAAPPTVKAQIEVVGFVLALSNLPSQITDISAFADPCIAIQLRQALATKLGIPIYLVILTSAGSLPLTPSSPGNALNTIEGLGCPVVFPTSRRLQGGERQLTGSGAVGVSVPAQIGPNLPSQSQPLGTIAGISASMGSGVSAPYNSTVSVPVTYPPRVGAYVPDPIINFFHSIPRRDPTASVQPDNTFTVDDLGYFKGALFPAGGIIALAILSLIMYSLAYTCGCCACACCKCRKKRDRDVYDHGCKKVCGTPRAFFFFALVNVGLILATIGYTSRFVNGVQTLADATDEFIATVSDGGDLMASMSPIMTEDGIFGPSVYVASINAANASQTSLDLCAASSNDCASTVKSIMQAVHDGTSSAAGSVHDAGNLLIDTGKVMKDARGQVDVEMVKASISKASYALLAILAFILFSWSAMICKNRCASIVFKIIAPVNILLITLIIILTGVYYAIAIIGSDVCVAPNDVLWSLASKTGAAGGAAGDTLSYYLHCGANPALPPMGAYKLLLDNMDTIDGVVEQVTSLDDQIQANPNDPAWSAMGPTYPHWAATNISSAGMAIHTIADRVVSCAHIDPIISKLWDGVCNGGFATVGYMFRILIAASVLLIVQLGIGVDVCCFHPGDGSRWLTDQEKNEKAMGLPTDGASNATFAYNNKMAGQHGGNGIPKTAAGTVV